MTTSATKAFGSKLYRGGSGTPKTSGTEIEEIFSIDPPEALCEMLEATSHDSTKGEHINSYVDEGDISIEMNYTAATGQEALRGDLGGDATGYYINLAGGSGYKQLDFSACVHSFKLGSLGIKDKITATAKLKITGAVTWTNQS